MNDGASVRGEAMRENVKSLTLRLSAEEYARLCRLAELSGLKLEPTVRSLIMGAQPRPRPPGDVDGGPPAVIRHRYEYQPNRQGCQYLWPYLKGGNRLHCPDAGANLATVKAL